MYKHHLHIRISNLVIVLLLTIQITIAQTISLDITKQEVSCAGMEDGRAVVTADGGQSPYSYVWSNGSENQVINNLGPGTYQVTVTDMAGNTAISAIGLLDVEEVEISLEKIDGFCGAKGKIEASVSGGVGPFQYRWSNGEFTREINDLEQGSYSVTITDRNACPQTASIEVIVHGEGLKLSSDFTIPSCFGDNDGYISVSQTGGEMPIDYSWSNGATGTSIENLAAGTYTVFATDAYGCTDGLVFILQDRDQLTVELIDQNNALYAKVEGGTPSYSYTWSNGVTGTSVINNLEPGDYSLTVEDAKGCSTAGSGEILMPLSIAPTDELAQFDTYPTVVTDVLYVDVQIRTNEKTILQIFDLTGTLIWKQDYSQKISQTLIPISNEWNSGAYVLILKGESGWSSSKMFIKQ